MSSLETEGGIRIKTDLNLTVCELVVENPAATRVFEKFGIDYCCGSGKSLREACEAVNVAPDKLLESLRAPRSWQLVVSSR